MIYIAFKLHDKFNMCTFNKFRFCFVNSSIRFCFSVYLLSTVCAWCSGHHQCDVHEQCHVSCAPCFHPRRAPHLCLLSVPQYGRDVHAHLQPGVLDATARPLEWMLTVSCTHDRGFPLQFLGSLKWTSGNTQPHKVSGENDCAAMPLASRVHVICTTHVKRQHSFHMSAKIDLFTAIVFYYMHLNLVISLT